MKLTLLVCLFLLVAIQAYGSVLTATKTVQQPFLGNQSPDDARTAAIARAKREALEQVGTYVQSETIVKDSQLEKDEILSLTAGITKTNVISQRNYAEDGIFWVEVKVQVDLDTDNVDKSLKYLLEDRSHLKQLKTVVEREKSLLAKISSLEELLKNKKNSNTGELKSIAQKLTAIGKYEKAQSLLVADKNANAKLIINYLSEAIALDPSFSSAYVDRGFIFGILKQNAEAIVDFNKAIGIDNKNAVAFNNRGVAFSSQHKQQKALSDYTTAIEIDPDYTSPYNNRGILYLQLGKLNEALSDLTKAIGLNPKYAQAYANRGNVYDDLHQPDKALEDYEQSIALRPDLTDGYVNRSNLYIDMGKFQDAIDDANMAIKIEPHNSTAYMNRGNALTKMGMPEQAISDYNTAVKYKPNDAGNYLNRGNAYLDLKQFKDAIRDYDKAISLNKDMMQAYYNKGRVYSLQKLYSQSIKYYSHAIKLAPKNPLPYKQRGFSFLLTGKTKSGCQDLVSACDFGDCSGLEIGRNDGACR